jgi:hypothetical protein
VHPTQECAPAVPLKEGSERNFRQSISWVKWALIKSELA